MEVFVWNSFSCNNSSDYRLVAEFATPEKATAVAKELTAFFEKHAEQYDAVANTKDFEWPGTPTKAAYELGTKYGFAWSEFLIWGEEQLVGDEPSVTSVGTQVVLYHTYSSGGFGPDVPRVLKQAGGTLPEKEALTGPPILLGEFTLPTGKKREQLLTTLGEFFVQSGYPHEYAPLPGLQIENGGRDEQYSFAHDDTTASFTYPIDPQHIADLKKLLVKLGAQDLGLRLATNKEVVANRKRGAKLDAARDKVLAAAEKKGAPKKQPASFSPAGLSFLFTGKLRSMTRAAAQDRAKKLGGTIAGSANKALGVLVIGDDGSPLFGQGTKGDKQRKVEALNAAGAAIKIISETDFLLLGASEQAPPNTTLPTVELALIAKNGAAWCGAFASENELAFVGGLGSDSMVTSKDGNKFKPRKISGRGLRALLVVGDTAYKCGEYGSFARSEADFSEWKPIATQTSHCLFGLAAAPDGAIWLTGDKGFVLRSTNGKTFTPVKGISSRASQPTLTQLGLLIPTAAGLYRVDGAAVKKLGLTKNINRVVQTRTGALVAVGNGNAVYRSTDNGKTFRAAKVPAWKPVKTKGTSHRTSWITAQQDLNVIVALPDGRLVVGGDAGVVLASVDDGVTFTRLDQKVTDATFWGATVYRGAAYLGGEGGSIVRVG